MSFLFLVAGAILVYGITKGWFSPPRAPPLPVLLPTEDCDFLRQRLSDLERQLFDSKNAVLESEGTISGLAKRLQAAYAETAAANAQLKKAGEMIQALVAEIKKMQERLDNSDKENDRIRSECMAKDTTANICTFGGANMLR